MNKLEEQEHMLPSRMARRRLIAGRLAVGVAVFNTAFALIGGWALSGPAAGVTRFHLGFVGWTLALFAASLLLSIPLAGLLIMKLLQPPAE